MTGRPRARRRILIAAVAGLLFQQLALAAYSCPAAAPVEPAASAHCEGDLAHATADNPALCAGHCAVDTPAPADASPKAPAAWAMAPLFSVLVPEVPRTLAMDRVRLPVPVPDPPPRLRYCSLLI